MIAKLTSISPYKILPSLNTEMEIARINPTENKDNSNDFIYFNSYYLIMYIESKGEQTSFLGLISRPYFLNVETLQLNYRCAPLYPLCLFDVLI